MTNLIVAAVSFLLFTALVLAVARAGKTYMFGLSIAFILMSNITVQMSTEILPGVTISWAIVIYSLVYLITDLVIEFYGLATAYKLAAVNLAVQILFWVYIWLSLMAIPADAGNSAQVYATMKALFGTTTQITCAAILAAAGPFTDIFLTMKIRGYLSRRKLFSSEILNLLARAKLSTFLGEFVNTVIFFGIALAGTETTYSTQVSIILSATVAKWVIALADVPFLWTFFRFIGPPADSLSQ